MHIISRLEPWFLLNLRGFIKQLAITPGSRLQDVLVHCVSVSLAYGLAVIAITLYTDGSVDNLFS